MMNMKYLGLNVKHLLSDKTIYGTIRDVLLLQLMTRAHTASNTWLSLIQSVCTCAYGHLVFTTSWCRQHQCLLHFQQSEIRCHYLSWQLATLTRIMKLRASLWFFSHATENHMHKKIWTSKSWNSHRRENNWCWHRGIPSFSLEIQLTGNRLYG